MRVLITNNTLASRCGSELYVRDLAAALRARGHEVAAYSNVLGEVAGEIAAGGVPVVDDLARLPWRPEIIHGQHHLEAMTAVAFLRGVPAVYLCHGWRPWQEAPPRHPRILAYAAVDALTRDDAVRTHGVPADAIRILPNFVDLDRFPQRPPLPARPARGLVFSNYASERTHLPAVREACAQVGIALDVVGYGSGHPSERPEDLLGRYDIVFAKGRCALEALAVGAAVVICDEPGTGPLVLRAELERLRSLNFGVAAITAPPDPASILREIQRYDPADAATVTEAIRAVAGLGTAVDALLAWYREVITRHHNMPIDEAGEERALAAYLRRLSVLVKHRENESCRTIAILRGERDALDGERLRLEAEISRMQGIVAAGETQGRAQAAALVQALSVNAALRAALDEVQGSIPVRMASAALRTPALGPLLRRVAALARALLDRKERWHGQPPEDNLFEP